MSCYHPMIYIQNFDMHNIEDRKIYNIMHAKHLDDPKFSKYVSGLLITRELAEKEGVDLAKHHAILVPCGRCIGCRLDYSRQWAERAVHEAQQYENNYFLTLTYDDDHLPRGQKNVATLIKDEVSAFMKRFRKNMKKKYNIDGIRFFACGEYGDGTHRDPGDPIPDVMTMFRPHYHIILFNCPIPDLRDWYLCDVDGRKKRARRYDTNGQLMQFSDIVDMSWQYRGDAPIGLVSYESCAYVARYVVKKLYGEGAKQYDDVGVIPPFVRMSRDPGIGFNWYMTNMEHIYEFDSVTFKRGDKVVQMKPGKYCDKLLKKENPGYFYNVKKVRQEAFYDSVDCKSYEAIDLYLNNLKAEDEKKRSVKLLKRNLV